MPTPEIFTSVINLYLPEPHASLLNGIIFGINLRTSKIFYDQLKIVGLLHLVVLSGINITLLAVIVGNLTRFLSKVFSLLTTILIIILFIWFVGPQAPIVRAGFMGILTYVGVLLKRKTYPLFIIFLSLLFILIFWPKWLTTLSLQLSYGATLGLLFFGHVSFPKKHLKTDWQIFIEKIKFFFWKELKPSLAAQIFTAPLIFFYFHQISFISPISNLLVAPLVAPLMIFGLVTAFLGKINFYLGLPFSYVCYILLSWIVFIIQTLSKIPYVFISF
jgi:competence protein ComEC